VGTGGDVAVFVAAAGTFGVGEGLPGAGVVVGAGVAVGTPV